mmetsp:Transcript_731/g.1149  ORF Transcript_731/g.1149 Transcript_731/m.1149 type:complete len:205 (-) Transcript_731:13-627(-)
MVDRNAVTVVNGDVFADQRPATAGLPLAVIGKDGLLASPLHPPTHPLFQYSRKRQAYGSVSPRVVPAIRHQPLRDASQYEDECRKRWYMSFAKDREVRAHSAQSARGCRRAFGASGGCSTTEESPGNISNNWTWQSWRGWTNASRHNHELRMKEAWLNEARARWNQKMPESEWRLSTLRNEMRELELGATLEGRMVGWKQSQEK